MKTGVAEVMNVGVEDKNESELKLVNLFIRDLRRAFLGRCSYRSRENGLTTFTSLPLPHEKYSVF